MYRYVYVYSTLLVPVCSNFVVASLRIRPKTLTEIRAVYGSDERCAFSMLLVCCVCVFSFRCDFNVLYIVWGNTLTSSAPQRTHIFYANISAAFVLDITLIYGIAAHTV